MVNARPIPTNTRSGQRLEPVSWTPVVTDATKSPVVVVPRKSIAQKLKTNKHRHDADSYIISHSDIVVKDIWFFFFIPTAAQKNCINEH